MADNNLDSLFSRLGRFPDVEAANLQAWDATDRLLLDTAADLLAAGSLHPGSRLAVVGDRYGALTLGALALDAPASAAGSWAGPVRVHQDLITGERALRHNAGKLGVTGGFEQLPLGAGLLSGASVVLLQLPKSLAELEEIADAVARHAAPDVVLLAGGRVKHMSLGMNAVLERYFSEVQPQHARQKSRILLARGPRPATGAPPFPVTEVNTELGLTVCARGAVFAGTGLDIGTRFLLEFLPRMPPARHAIDLGCGTGILAAMYARGNPGSRVTATDQSAAAVDSARATAEANGLAGQITVLQDDAMGSLPDGQRRSDPAQPALPRRSGGACRGRHQADRGGRTGPRTGRGALDGVQQPPPLPARAAAADRPHPRGRPEPEIHGDRQHPEILRCVKRACGRSHRRNVRF